ncbi:hypothetical protein FRC04_011529 [Tulasnella sp. 424]|nr:hypothetical protein FRC04_011529 [Tulasnella sp. 424]KAG8971649.1 hypothetical protein FRC05_010905 [Tulasnella sp. 425]
MALSIVRTLFALVAVVGLASADHNVTVQAWDLTNIKYTIPDSSGATSTSGSPSGTNLPNSGSHHKGVNGGLIGGVVAGVVIVILIGIIAFLLCARKRARQRQPHPIDLGAEQHPLPPPGLTVPQDMTWTPWTPDATQGFAATPGSQMSKTASRTPSTANLAAPIAIPAAQVPAPSSSSGRDSLYQSERTGSSPTAPTDPLVQRISETVAAILREGTSPPPAYQHPAPAQPPRPWDP